MKTLKPYLLLQTLVGIGVLAGCSATTKSPDVTASLRKSLDQAGLKDVSVSQDREKGVVTRVDTLRWTPTRRRLSLSRSRWRITKL
ncbi:MAG: hypothetical protein WBW33_20105 [Bryobacteraceae bacterium]